MSVGHPIKTHLNRILFPGPVVGAGWVCGWNMHLRCIVFHAGNVILFLLVCTYWEISGSYEWCWSLACVSDMPKWCVLETKHRLSFMYELGWCVTMGNSCKGILSTHLRTCIRECHLSTATFVMLWQCSHLGLYSLEFEHTYGQLSLHTKLSTFYLTLS